VLTRLPVERGGAVSVDRMIDQLWQGSAPPKTVASLQAYVSNLGRAPEPDRPPRTPAAVLVSIPPGYGLRLAAGAAAKAI
jgi:DNA-binding SARP family transcriptional activator